MNELQNDAFHVPALFVFLCCFAAAAFLLGTYFWLWRAGRVAHEEKFPSLWSDIAAFQYYSFLSVVVLSCVMGVYDYVVAGENLAIYAEGVILFLAMAAAFFRAGAARLLRLIRSVFMFFIAVCGFWVISIAAGWLIFHGLYAVYSSFAPLESFSVVAVLCVGVAWIAPIFLLYRRLSTPQRRGVKFYQCLMPVMLAYLMLILPLFIQQTANSQKWHDLTHAKPVPRKI